MDLIVKENKLILNNTEFLQAVAGIKMFLLVKEDNIIIVLVDPLQLQNDKNVFCYGFDKELKWQISDIDNKLHTDNYYTSVYLSNENNLIAYNVNGVELTIDKYSGQIMKKELIK